MCRVLPPPSPSLLPSYEQKKAPTLWLSFFNMYTIWEILQGGCEKTGAHVCVTLLVFAYDTVELPHEEVELIVAGHDEVDRVVAAHAFVVSQ